MKAVVFHGVGDIRLDDVPEPIIEQPTDAVIEVIASAICGTDLHFVRGTVPGMRPGTILGHEAVGIVADVGSDVRNFSIGDRVVVTPTIACGNCSYCRDGYFAQCDHANPHGRRAGTAFFGGPPSWGGFNGLQAEMARIPFANLGLVKLPDHMTHEHAILLADIFPSGYFAAELAEVKTGDVVAVFGCGPVGQFAMMSAFLLGAARVFAIDNVPQRLEVARSQGAEAINFDDGDPVHAIMDLTRGIGPDRVIEAVGVDARSPRQDSQPPRFEDEIDLIERQRSQVSPVPDPSPRLSATESRIGGEAWHRGDAPLQALLWAVDAIAKAGSLAIIGVYPSRFESFPIGKAFDKNLTIKMGVCHHRRYIPKLVQMVAAGEVDPTLIIARQEKLISATEAYESFGRRETGWLQVGLVPST
jgi:threonine dehydrogenase-like Zn-dependent dehydrogenase